MAKHVINNETFAGLIGYHKKVIEKCEELVEEVKRGDTVEVKVTDTETQFPLKHLVNEHFVLPLARKIRQEFRQDVEDVIGDIEKTVIEALEDGTALVTESLREGREVLGGFLQKLGDKVTPAKKDDDKTD
jgi:hypothetical protein